MSEIPPSRGPIRRDPRLYGLSHEHHTGLIVAWRLQQGIKGKSDPGVMARYIRYHWQAWLNGHLQLEEELLFSHLPGQNGLVKQALHEHQQLADYFERLDATAQPDHFQPFTDLLYRHIRFEERILYPFAEKHLTSAQLEHIKQAFNAKPEFCESWKPTFWQE